jgi:hypothetical protein
VPQEVRVDFIDPIAAIKAPCVLDNWIAATRPASVKPPSVLLSRSHSRIFLQCIGGLHGSRVPFEGIRMPIPMRLPFCSGALIKPVSKHFEATIRGTPFGVVAGDAFL